MKTWSPTELALSALKRKPAVGVPISHDTVCAACGKQLKAGDEALPYNVDQKTFMNFPDLRGRESSFFCVHCSAVFKPDGYHVRDYLAGFTQALFTPDGAYRFVKNTEMASIFLNPPRDTPFILVRSNAKQQHIIWRAPVNYSHKRYQLRFGNELATIRHDLLMDAAYAQRYILDEIRHAKLFKYDKKSVFSSSGMNAMGNHSDYRARTYEIDRAILGEKTFASAVKSIQALNFGERFALCVIGQSNLREAEPLVSLI